MARDRTPRDAFGRPLDPDADFGTGATDATDRAFGTPTEATAGSDAAGSANHVFGTDPPRTGAVPLTSRPATAPGDAERARRWEASPSPPASEATNPQATVALVLAVLGLVVLPYVLSVAAIVIANRADRAADAVPGAPGRSAARMGRILGYVGLGLWLVLPAVTIFVLLLASSGSG